MIRTTALFSAHAIHRLIRNILLLVVAIVLLLFIWLNIGIKVDRFVLGHYQVKGLYIKFDKKLTLKAQEIVLPQTKEKPSLGSIDKTFDKIKTLFTFFDYIELEKIVFENNTFHFIFVEDILYIRNKTYEISGKIRREENLLIAEVSSLHIKKENLFVKGALVYNIDQETLHTQGQFSGYEIKGKFRAKKHKNSISFSLKSDRFESLKPLISRTPLNSKIQSWIVDKVQAKQYQLHHLEGVGYITSDGFKIDYQSIKGDMSISDVVVKYQPKPAPVLTDRLLLRYVDEKLFIDFDNPSYLDRKMKGSHITFTGLGSAEPLLSLHLLMHTAMDKKIHEILRAYKVDIPVSYKGKTDVTLDMRIPLSKRSKRDLHTKVKVVLKQGILRYDTTLLPIQKGLVEYDSQRKEKERLYAVGTLRKGDVSIEKLKFPLQSGKLYYKKEKIRLQKLHLKDKAYEGRMNGSIDIRKKKATLDVELKRLLLGSKPTRFSMNKKSLSIYLSYAKHIKVSIPSLAIQMLQKGKTYTIQIKELEKIKKYIKKLPIALDNGHLNIVTSDFKTYRVDGTLLWHSCFFYTQADECYTTVPLQGKVDTKKIYLEAFNRRFSFDSHTSRIEISDIHIDLKKLLNRKKGLDSVSKSKKTLRIIGKDSKLRYNNNILVTDRYDIKIQPNGDIVAKGSLDSDSVHFSKKGEKFILKALKVKDKMLHPLIQFDGIKGGRYTITQKGNPDGVMHGKIIVEGGLLSDFKAYNNTLAFINTLPALATLSNPGFSKKGFRIQEGAVVYYIAKERVSIESIYIKGSSVTIVGKGSIDLKRRTINIDLALRTARELGKFLDKIPLVGYVLMGEDKSMTIGLKIHGDLDNPKIETSAAKEILHLPINIIKRVLSL